jgi:hypothetical protein
VRCSSALRQRFVIQVLISSTPSDHLRSVEVGDDTAAAAAAAAAGGSKATATAAATATEAEPGDISVRCDIAIIAGAAYDDTTTDRTPAQAKEG